MASQSGYRGGGTRCSRSFHTGLLGSDSTGANVISKSNEKINNQKTGRSVKQRKGRWG